MNTVDTVEIETTRNHSLLEIIDPSYHGSFAQKFSLNEISRMSKIPQY